MHPLTSYVLPREANSKFAGRPLTIKSLNCESVAKMRYDEKDVTCFSGDKIPKPKRASLKPPAFKDRRIRFLEGRVPAPFLKAGSQSNFDYYVDDNATFQTVEDYNHIHSNSDKRV